MSVGTDCLTILLLVALDTMHSAGNYLHSAGEVNIT